MLTKQHVYFGILFGSSLILCLQSVGFALDNLIELVFSGFNLNNFSNVISIAVRILIYILGFLFCYTVLPSNHNKLTWLKTMVNVFTVVYLVSSIINSVSFFFRPGFEDMSFALGLFARFFSLPFVLSIILLILNNSLPTKSAGREGPPPIFKT